MSSSTRTYRGRSLEELIPLIHAELGPEAIIVRRREGLTGGVFGFFQHAFIEIEAMPGAPRLDLYDSAHAAPPPAPTTGFAAPAASLDAGAGLAAGPAGAGPYAAYAPAPPPAVQPPAAPARPPAAAALGYEHRRVHAEPQAPAAPPPRPGGYLSGSLAAFAGTGTPLAPSAPAATEQDERFARIAAEFSELTPPTQPFSVEREMALSGELPGMRPPPGELPGMRPPPPEVPGIPPAAREPPGMRPPAAEPPDMRPGGAALPGMHVPARERLLPREPPPPPLRPEGAPAAEPLARPAEGGGLEYLPSAPPPRFVAPAPERRTVPAGSHARARAGVEKSLRRLGVSEELAGELIDAALAHTLPLAPRLGLAQAVRSTLAQRIPVAPPLPTRGGAIALVGAGGAGKTTFCAALVAAYRAGSSLKPSFATIIRGGEGGSTLELLLAPAIVKPVPADSPRASRALRRAREEGLAVIDTPRLTPSDRGAVRELAKLLGEFEPERTVVALPATLGPTAAEQLLAALRPLGAESLALTHADETDQIGVAVEAACRFELAPEFVLEHGPAGGWRLTRIDPSTLASRLLA